MKFCLGPLSHRRYIIFSPRQQSPCVRGWRPSSGRCPHTADRNTSISGKTRGHKAGRQPLQCLSLSHLCLDCESLCECCHFFFGWGSNLADTSCRPPGPHPSLSQTKHLLANCICCLQSFICRHDVWMFCMCFLFSCFFISLVAFLIAPKNVWEKETRQGLLLSSNTVPCANSTRLLNVNGKGRITCLVALTVPNWS